MGVEDGVFFFLAWLDGYSVMAGIWMDMGSICQQLWSCVYNTMMKHNESALHLFI